MRPQRGFTLVVGLVMLVLMTIVAMVAFNMGKGSLQVVDNMQQRNQAQAAAQYSLDQAISGLAFSDTPSTVFANNQNCPSGVVVGPGTNSNGICIDVNGDGKTVVRVGMSPQPRCISSAPVALAQLDLTKQEDQSCVIAGGNVSLGKVTTGSNCYNTLWDVNAVASEPVSEAQVQVSEGVTLRKGSDVVSNYCPTS